MGFHVATQRTRPFQCGDVVQILDGEYAGETAIIHEIYLTTKRGPIATLRVNYGNAVVHAEIDTSNLLLVA